MLAFLDESGDPGMKLDHGSSRLFVIGLVTFEDHDEAAACDAEIDALRARLSLPATYEFHCSANSDRIQEQFLRAVSGFDFSTHVFALDKAKASGPGFQFKDSLYKWTARTAFENARPYLENATLVIDGSGDRQFRKQLSAYLRQRVNRREGPTHIQKVKIQPSHQNNLLQLADYVASVSAAALNYRKKAVELRRNYLAAHEITNRRWPS